jgi:hypothetical protein
LPIPEQRYDLHVSLCHSSFHNSPELQLILLDDASLDEIYGRVRGARVDRTGWILPTASRPANMSFVVGNRFYTISGEDLKFADAGNGMSFGAIQSRGQNKQDIFGDVNQCCMMPLLAF